LQPTEIINNFGTQNSLAEINTYVKDETSKAPRAGIPADIGQAKIKKVAGQLARQIPKADPNHQAAAAPAHERGNTPTKPNHDLADLIWKYFSEEITQAVIEVQQALAQELKGPSRHSGPRKG
jgi:hypothetical protein